MGINYSTFSLLIKSSVNILKYVIDSVIAMVHLLSQTNKDKGDDSIPDGSH